MQYDATPVIGVYNQIQKVVLTSVPEFLIDDKPVKKIVEITFVDKDGRETVNVEFEFSRYLRSSRFQFEKSDMLAQDPEKPVLEIYENTSSSMAFSRNRIICEGDYFKDIGCNSDHFKVYIQPYLLVSEANNIDQISPYIKSSSQEHQLFSAQSLGIDRTEMSTSETEEIVSENSIKMNPVVKYFVFDQFFRDIELDFKHFGKINVGL